MLCFQRDEMGDLRAYDEPAYTWGYETAWDFETFEDAKYTAEELNTVLDEEVYEAVDRGENITPRYDVIRLPQVGDEVSKGFNGDYYPCGKIVRITQTKVVTEDGTVFRRAQQSGVWKEQHKSPFCMVLGVHSRWNPSF